MTAHDTQRLATFLAVAAFGCVIAAHPSLAQAVGLLGGSSNAIATTVSGGGQLAITTVRAISLLVAIFAFLSFAFGRHHPALGVGALVGTAGAVKADLIVNALGLG